MSAFCFSTLTTMQVEMTVEKPKQDESFPSKLFCLTIKYLRKIKFYTDYIFNEAMSFLSEVVYALSHF